MNVNILKLLEWEDVLHVARIPEGMAETSE